MKVEFTFDNSRIEQNGYTLEDIRYTIKKMFVERNIRCISDNNILAFEDSGGKNDFSSMRIIIMGLTRTDWFMSFATSCIWRESENQWEDVLRQARERRQERKQA